ITLIANHPAALALVPTRLSCGCIRVLVAPANRRDGLMTRIVARLHHGASEGRRRRFSGGSMSVWARKKAGSEEYDDRVETEERRGDAIAGERRRERTKRGGEVEKEIRAESGRGVRGEEETRTRMGDDENEARIRGEKRSACWTKTDSL